ncbi:MAG TPA: protein kinase [Oscillospiraceae bacterium]|nr:protein kinase [Oscillospiraceae bacterium]
MIGKILGNRYQIVEKIGDGGTAFVYKGMDNLLNRHVTIKVLRPEYVSDQDFVRRFRREAQAAASLSHPNIVSIYDVGYEDGIHYIVMEYIHGRSLKELITELERLPVRMAVEYALHMAQALEHAHKHGIIHRDVKPHNILISEDGRIKVTDFGIAQAVTASTITYNNGSILGSVHYFSPEQARGGLTDEKSDIYSLGIVLFEMLTGQVPYQGQSPVSIALKHLQEPFPKAKALNPEIPDSINQIISRAVEKEPEDRFPSVQAMASELTAWLQGREGRRSTMEPVPITGGKGMSKGQHKTAAKRPRARTAAIAGAVLLLALFAFGVVRLLQVFYVPEVEVPTVEGETLQKATIILEEAGLTAALADQIPSDTVPAGAVIRQDPAAGKKVKEGRKITLTLSTGPQLVQVDSVVGKMRREAALLLEENFVVEINEVHSVEAPNTVVSQDPGAGNRIAKGSTVTLNISKGGQPFKLKDLRGLSLEEATTWLELFNLNIRHVAEENNEDIGAGLIYSQFPEPNEMVQAGDFVDLYLSKGPKELPTPELEQYPIEINTEDIPAGETITVVIHDETGDRTETYTSDGQPITIIGFGSGTVEVKWNDQVDTKSFP